MRWPANKNYDGNDWTFERSINVDYGECINKLEEPTGGYDLGTDRSNQIKCGVSHCMQAQGGGGHTTRKTKKILCQRVCLIGGDLTVQPLMWNQKHYANLFLRDDGSLPPWNLLSVDGGHCPGDGCRWEARCLLNKINICVKNDAYSKSKCAGCSDKECQKKYCPQFTCSAQKTIKCLAILLAGKATLYSYTVGDHTYTKNVTMGDTPVAPYSKAQKEECTYHGNACMKVGMVL